ncbi:hypothetical protein LX36DRAFT_739706 [Colletotrichum falcatum]|nr:hypothetical protein LX36DRAFT_739706 [Colletotrichum falcatum]
MAPRHRDVIGKVSYNVWLDAFDDCLWSSEPRPEKMRLVASVFQEHQWLKTKNEIREDWYRRQDSWRLPTAHEKEVDKWGIDHHCFWVGWFIPHLHRHYEDRSPKPGQSVNQCSGEVLNHYTVRKAFKVVYKPGGTKKNRLFALYSPDRNGVCKAISVPGGVCSVLFFEEWRDDTLTARTARQRSWLKKVMSTSLTELSSFTPAATSEQQSNERERQVISDDELSLSGFFVEDQPSSCDDSDSDDSDLDESEYVYSGSESSESDNDSESSRNGAPVGTVDDAEEESEVEHMGHKITDVCPMRRDTVAHTSSIASARDTALHNRLSARKDALQATKAAIKSTPSFPFHIWGLPLLNMGIPDRDAAGERSETRQRVRATPSGTRVKKRQIGRHDDLGSRPKRSRPSRRTSGALVKTENGDTSGGHPVKIEKAYYGDDEVQLIHELSLTRTRKKPPVRKTSVAASVSSPTAQSVAFVLEFIAADKLVKVARLQDAVSRRVTLKAFRKHLASTSETDSDAVAHNIAENEDEDTRMMLAEALVADLREKLRVAVPRSDSSTR